MAKIFRLILILTVCSLMAIGAEVKGDSLDSIDKEISLLLGAGKYSNAEYLIKKTLKKTAEKYGPTSYQVVDKFQKLGNVYLILNDYKAALENSRCALELCKYNVMARNLVPDLNLSVGLSYAGLKEYSNAIPYLKDSIAARLPLVNKKELTNDYVVAFLVKIYQEFIAGKWFKNAEISLLCAFYIIDNNIDLKSDHAQTRILMTGWLGQALEEQGRYKEAEDKLIEYADSIENDEKIPLDKKHSAYLELGDFYLRNKKHIKAKESFVNTLKYEKEGGYTKKDLLIYLEGQKKKYKDQGDMIKSKKISNISDEINSEFGTELVNVDLLEKAGVNFEQVITKKPTFDKIEIFDYLPEKEKMMPTVSLEANSSTAVIAIPYDLKSPNIAMESTFGRIDADRNFMEKAYKRKVEFLNNDFDRLTPLGVQYGYLIRKDKFGKSEMLAFREFGSIDNKFFCSWSNKEKAEAKMRLKEFTVDYEKFEDLKRSNCIANNTLYPEDLSLKMSEIIVDILKSKNYGQIIDLSQYRGAFRNKTFKKIVEEVRERYGVKYVTIFLFKPNSKWTMSSLQDGHIYPDNYTVTNVGLRIIFACMIYDTDTGNLIFGEYSMESALSPLERRAEAIVYHTEETNENKETSHKDGILERDRLIKMLKLRLSGEAPRVYFDNKQPLKELIPYIWKGFKKRQKEALK